MKHVAMVAITLVLPFLAGCIGTVDLLLRVRGHVVDSRSTPYSHCEVKLLESGSGEVLGRQRVDGADISVGFTVHSLWSGVEIGITCDGAGEAFRSQRIGWGGGRHPVDLGTVVLKRTD